MEALSTLVIAPWARRLGGAEEMLWTFLRAYDPQRLEVSVVFLEAGPFERDVAALGIPTTVVESGRLRSPVRVVSTICALARLIRRDDPDVVLNWMAKTQLYGAPAAALSRAGTRVIWWQHLTPSGHWMDRVATRLPAAAIGASSEASAVAQRRTTPSRRTVCVHPGIAQPADAIAKAVRRSDLGLSDAAVLIVLAGRLQPWKGQDRAIRAARLLRDQGLDVELLVVGGTAFGFDVEYPCTLRDLVAELDLEGRVSFAGQVDDAIPYLRVGDIALNASEGEPFGIVLIEAMSLSLPVVAVSADGPIEITDHGRAGRLARDGSPEALAEALRPLVEDRVQREQLGETGRHRVETHFSAATMALRMTELIESATG